MFSLYDYSAQAGYQISNKRSKDLTSPFFRPQPTRAGGHGGQFLFPTFPSCREWAAGVRSGVGTRRSQSREPEARGRGISGIRSASGSGEAQVSPTTTRSTGWPTWATSLPAGLKVRRPFNISILQSTRSCFKMLYCCVTMCRQGRESLLIQWHPAMTFRKLQLWLKLTVYNVSVSIFGKCLNFTVNVKYLRSNMSSEGSVIWPAAVVPVSRCAGQVLMSCVINKCNPSSARGSEIPRIRHQMDQLPHCGGILVTTKPRKLSSSWEKYHEGCHEYLLVIQSVCGSPLSSFSVWLTWIFCFFTHTDILHPLVTSGPVSVMAAGHWYQYPP